MGYLIVGVFGFGKCSYIRMFLVLGCSAVGHLTVGYLVLGHMGVRVYGLGILVVGLFGFRAFRCGEFDSGIWFWEIWLIKFFFWGGVGLRAICGVICCNSIWFWDICLTGNTVSI